jgi:hypothetical protein
MAFDPNFIVALNDDYASDYQPGDGSGYSVTTEVMLQYGWKVYLRKPNPTFFPFDYGDRPSADAAREAALEAIRTAGEDTKKFRPQVCVQTVLSKESVVDTDEIGISKAAKWQTDIAKEVQTTWFDRSIAEANKNLPEEERKNPIVVYPSYEQYLLPFLRDFPVEDLGKWFWAAVGVKKDIGKPTWKDNEGKERDNLINVVLRRFANEAEARAAVESGDPLGYGADSLPEPKGWDTKFGEWVDSAEFIKQQLTESLSANSPAPMVSKKIAELVSMYNPSEDDKVSLTGAITSVWNALSKSGSNIPF